MTIHIVAILKAKPGQESELRQALLTLIPPVLQEPGCIQYTLHESLDHPGHFVFYEAWADQAAIDRHGNDSLPGVRLQMRYPSLPSLCRKQFKGPHKCLFAADSCCCFTPKRIVYARLSSGSGWGRFGWGAGSCFMKVR
jgi:quinol monooxygenase YgiN